MVNMKIVSNNYGVYEWMIVRLSGILISLYFIYLFSFLLYSNHLSYEEWCLFFNNSFTKIFNIVILLFILIHTWIGIRHILEDYIKSIILRRLGIGATFIVLHIYLLLGIKILWGI